MSPVPRSRARRAVPHTRTGRSLAATYVLLVLTPALVPLLCPVDSVVAVYAMLLTLPWSVALVPSSAVLAEPLTAAGDVGAGSAWRAASLTSWGAMTLALLIGAGLNVAVCTWAAHAHEDRVGDDRPL